MNTPDPWHEFISQHLRQRPAMQLSDIYKLLYQGVRGPEHIIASPQAFRARLAEEWAAIEVSLDDPLYEAVRPDGSLRRLNLRPFKAGGGSLERLADACLEAARGCWGSEADLRLAWESFARLYQAGAWPGLDLGDAAAFTAWLGEKGFPPLHHSEGYREAYRPAYRLVAAEIG